ncbi:MAG: DUF928 domain-containing protein [Cyanobacteria bacterium J06573_2]
MNHSNSIRWRNNRRFVSLLTVMLLLITIIPAYAKYKPKNRKPASGHSTAGGSRGGCQAGSIPLTLLAPNTFVGRTASLRPMLAWYSSKSGKVRFELYEFISSKKVKQIVESKEIPSIAGINKFRLPDDYPELTVGKTYFWQIDHDCGNSLIVNRAEFTVVNPPSITEKKFTTIPEAVNYYGENELWYEALEQALKTETDSKSNQTLSVLIQELAEAEMLIGSEINIQRIKKRIGHLEKISLAKYAKYKPRDRKPASGYSRSGCCR